MSGKNLVTSNFFHGAMAKCHRRRGHFVLRSHLCTGEIPPLIDLLNNLHWATQSRLKFRPGPKLEKPPGRNFTNEIADKRKS